LRWALKYRVVINSVKGRKRKKDVAEEEEADL
jgi:hypothetical protein